MTDFGERTKRKRMEWNGMLWYRNTVFRAKVSSSVLEPSGSLAEVPYRLLEMAKIARSMGLIFMNGFGNCSNKSNGYII